MIGAMRDLLLSHLCYNSILISVYVDHDEVVYTESHRPGSYTASNTKRPMNVLTYRLNKVP